MTPELRARAIALYDQFTHEGRDRRSFMREMTLLAGSTAAASALVAAIAASPAAAARIPADDARLKLGKGGYRLADGTTMTGYFASPRASKGKRGTVIVIHENRGLTRHIEDVARRFALTGYTVVAPDFLSPAGGTPADEDKARELIGKLDYDKVIAAGVATIAWAKRQPGSNGRVGVVGFCWGGALVNRLALSAGPALAAGVSYYGPAPAPAEAARVQVPLMLHYAGLDTRVAATGDPWAAALKAAGKPVEAFTYPGVDHAFNNDTSAARYNAEAAELAWTRTLGFFSTHAGPATPV